MTNNELTNKPINKPIDTKDNIEPKPLDVDSLFKLLVAFIVFSMPLWATIHTIYNLFFDRYDVFSPLWIIGLPMLPILFFMVASIAFMKRDRDVQAVIRIQKFAHRYIIFLLVVAIVITLIVVADDRGNYISAGHILATFACETLVYFIASIVCEKCFFDVLLKNRQWIIKYGFFAGSSSLSKKDDDVIDVEIT